MAQAPDAGAISRPAPAWHGGAGLLRPAQGETAGHLRLRGLWSAVVPGRNQVRERNRLAELLQSDPRRDRRDRGHELRHATHGGSLLALRRSPRTRLSRRAAADRAAL